MSRTRTLSEASPSAQSCCLVLGHRTLPPGRCRRQRRPACAVYRRRGFRDTGAQGHCDAAVLPGPPPPLPATASRRCRSVAILAPVPLRVAAQFAMPSAVVSGRPDYKRPARACARAKRLRATRAFRDHCSVQSYLLAWCLWPPPPSRVTHARAGLSARFRARARLRAPVDPPARPSVRVCSPSTIARFADV